MCRTVVGVALGRLPHKGSGRDSCLGHNNFSSHYNQIRFSHDGQRKPLGLLHCPAQLDLQAQKLLLYELAPGTVLHTHHTSFPWPLFRVFAVVDQTISTVH